MLISYEEAIRHYSGYEEMKEELELDRWFKRSIRMRFYRFIREVYSANELLGFIEFLNNNPQYENGFIKDLRQYIGKAYLEKLDVCIDLDF